MASALIVGAGGFGLLIGSFLNVVIFRVPAGRSIVSPPSACGACGARIRGFDNVPVLSWVLLRGRCRSCRASISVRYPLVELGTAVFFGVVAWWAFSGGVAGGLSAIGIASTVVALAAFLYLAAISVALTMIDLDTRTLPNRIVLPAYPVMAVFLTAAALLAGDSERLLVALIGAAVLFALYFVLAQTGGMGFGDVKLAGALGLALGWLGWGQLAVGTFGAFVLGGVFGLALLLLRRAGRRTAIPFGPWMLVGAWIGIFAGEPIAGAYLGLTGLA